MGRLSDSVRDEPLRTACNRVYLAISNAKTPLFEAELSRALLSPRTLGDSVALHGSYLRSALDILLAERSIKKKKAAYSLK